MTDVVSITQSLIRFRSVTPHDDGALSYVQTILETAGFTCHRLSFSETGTADIDNLYARIGTGSPHICFAGHTDVVPPGNEEDWLHSPFSSKVENDIIYGRGAADMKGGVAATIAAVLNYLIKKGSDFQGSISFLITGDEEGPAVNGTKKVVDWLINRNEHPDCCLLAECTAEAKACDTIKIGRRGSLSAKLTIRGLQGHVAYPQKSRNPIPFLLTALTQLKTLPLDDGNAFFQPSNLEVTSIDTGNPTHNVIPAVVTARFNIRYNNIHTSETLKSWIASKLASTLAETGVSYSIDYEPVTESFMTEPGSFIDQLKQAVREVTPFEAELSTAGGTSDARFIRHLCPVAEIGLRNEMAHKVDECVPIADLERLTDVFKRFLELSFDKNKIASNSK